MKRFLLGFLFAGFGLTYASDSWCVAVWYPSSEHPAGADSITANSDVIDIVHPFWYTPDATGVLLDASGSGGAEKLAAWRAAGLLIIPSIFSSDPGYVGADVRAAHIKDVVDLVETHEYDGIDIDFEMFPLESRGLFTAFVEELSAALHDRGRLLAVTVHAKTEASPEFASAAAQDWPRLAAAADIFNLMTYDYTHRNEPPGPVASIPWVGDVVTYALTATEASKIRVGLPFYGYSWTRGRPPARATTWEAANRMIERFQLPTLRHADSSEVYLELKTKGLPRQEIFVSDSVTTAATLSALPADLGGVAIWGLGGEDPDQWQVVRDQRPADCVLRRGPVLP